MFRLVYVICIDLKTCLKTDFLSPCQKYEFAVRKSFPLRSILYFLLVHKFFSYFLCLFNTNSIIFDKLKALSVQGTRTYEIIWNNLLGFYQHRRGAVFQG